ncbi:hypothetical protein PTKIN_Ptkin15bG0171900 [Pterospermum kingtungense]
MEEQQEDNMGGMERKRKLIVEGIKAYAICIFCNVFLAGYNIISKVSLDNGMSSYVLVVYGHVVGTLTTALFAAIFESEDVTVTGNNFLDMIQLYAYESLLLRAVLARTLYYMGLKDTSPAAASALSNLVPSMTFILAVLCRKEPLKISKLSAQAKVGGTVIALGGATLMTLYNGCVVISPHSAHHSQHGSGTSKVVLQLNKDWIKGSIMLMVSYLSNSLFLLLQTVTVKKYPASITLTSLTCLSGALLSATMAAILDRKAFSWTLSWDMSLVAVLYSGIVVFGLIFYLQSIVGRTKGAVFITAFRPLGTVIATIMAVLILGDGLFLGSTVGAIVIFLGLYITLWGKEKEKEKENKSMEVATSAQCLEIKSEMS